MAKFKFTKKEFNDARIAALQGRNVFKEQQGASVNQVNIQNAINQWRLNAQSSRPTNQTAAQ